MTGRQDMSESEPLPLARGLLSLVDLRVGQRWPLRRLGERDWMDPYVRWVVFQRDGGRCLSCGVQLTLKPPSWIMSCRGPQTALTGAATFACSAPAATSIAATSTAPWTLKARGACPSAPGA
jgi:hypothetical protein